MAQSALPHCRSVKVDTEDLTEDQTGRVPAKNPEGTFRPPLFASARHAEMQCGVLVSSWVSPATGRILGFNHHLVYA